VEESGRSDTAPRLEFAFSKHDVIKFGLQFLMLVPAVAQKSENPPG
jgi:hypothetical protein